MTCPYVDSQTSQPMQWRARMYTIGCSINSPPSPQVAVWFGNSVCFMTEYKARHSPIPVPFHLKEPVRQALWEHGKRGIITPVPVGMPTDWFSTMVITAKNNGKPPRRQLLEKEDYLSSIWLYTYGHVIAWKLWRKVVLLFYTLLSI